MESWRGGRALVCATVPPSRIAIQNGLMLLRGAAVGPQATRGPGYQTSRKEHTPFDMICEFKAKAQAHLASGESSCKHGNQHGAISSVDSAKAFAACPAAQARLASGESSSVHGAISSLRLHRRL